MLTILPFDRAQQQRDNDRPFKSYARSSIATPHNAPSSYYHPFSHSGVIGSLYPAHSNNVSEHSKHEGPMDLRPQSSMYDARLQYDGPPFMDMSAQFPNRIPNIKTEHSIMGHSLYSSVNTNSARADTNVYNTAMDMSNIRGIPPPEHPAMGNINSSVNTPPPNSGNQPDMRSLSHVAANQSDHYRHHTSTQDDNSRSQNGNNQSNRQNTSSNQSNSPSSSVASPSRSSNPDPDEEMKPPKKRAYIIPDDMKDNTYWEKRKKNNDSAKRSREARRMKEEQIAMRVVYLEQDNLQLRTEVSLLKSEIEKLRCMLYNS